MGESCGVLIHHAIRKYGLDQFEWDEVCSDVPNKDLNRMEIECIAWFGTKAPKGYNLTDGGDGFCGKHKSETKAKIAKASLSHWKDPVIRERILSGLRKAYPMLLGRKHTEESKEKNRKAHLGRHHRPESIAKMTGRKQSPELVAKRVAGNKGYRCSEKTKELMRSINGSIEARERSREASNAYWKARNWESCSFGA